MDRKLLMFFLIVVPILSSALVFAEDEALLIIEPVIAGEIKEICVCPSPANNKKSRKVVGTSKKSKERAARQARMTAHSSSLGEWKAACDPKVPDAGPGKTPKERKACYSQNSEGLHIATLCFDYPCL